MKNTIGESFAITLFGESHGEMIGCVIDGLAPGIKLDLDLIDHKLALRRPDGKLSTARIEKDEYKIVSGFVNGYTTGTPLTVLIPNTNTRSSDYTTLLNRPRPGHADYSANLKYHGYQDSRGGGHFSGRITAALVFAGAVAAQILENHDVHIGSHIKSLKDVKDDDFTINLKEEINSLNNKTFAVLNDEVKEKMKAVISAAKAEGDSVGGVLESVVYGLDGGIGEPWFDSLEGVLAKLLFSVPAVKGVEFGDGFKLTEMFGSVANDCFEIQNGKVITTTNHNGGINGGISNGMPIIIKTAIKPTPSIYKKQNTVLLDEMKNVELNIEGRHDPAIIQRARVVVDSVIAIGLVDMCSLRYGTDWQVK